MKKRAFPLEKVYRLLSSGPVVLISSLCNETPNIMPIAWTIPLDFDPPLVGCCIGDYSYTFSIVKKSRELVINIPTADLVKKVYACGKCSGREVDKFSFFGLTPSPASKVKAPLIEECYANLECRVVDMSQVKKYNLFIVEVVAAHVVPTKKPLKTLHHITGKRFMVGGREITA